MASCKECIYEPKCYSRIALGMDTYANGKPILDIDKRCKSFKNKENFQEVKYEEALLPLTVKEFRYLTNDLISYIWRLEDKGLDKEEFGYFSRKELLEKLKQFEKENFPELAQRG